MTHAEYTAETAKRLVALIAACEGAALDLECLDEDSDIWKIAARLRAAVAVARGEG